MRLNRFIFLLLTICLVQYCPGQLLNPTGPLGTIEVTVVNGTPDGHSVVGDLVTVRLIQNQTLIDTLQGKVNDESKVVFNNVARVPNLMVHASCEHEGAPFFGKPVPFFPDLPNMPNSITVFDVTTDKSSLSAQMHHITITQVGELLQVEEIMMISNSSMMAIKPEVSPVYNMPVTLEVFLPSGFQDFQVLSYFNPEDLVWTDEGFFDPVPIAPGEGDIRFNYFLKIDSDTKDISKKISLPTGTCVIFIKVPNVEVTGLGAPVSNMTMGGGMPVDFYQLSGKQPGDVVNIQLSGLTKMAAVTSDTSGLSVPMHHIIITQSGELLQVEETMILRNSSLMTITPEVSAVYNQPVSLEIFLPQGFQGFQSLSYFNQEELVRTEEGIFYSGSIAPGEGEIKFTYFLPLDSAKKDISKKFSLPTGNCIIQIPIPNVVISGLDAPVTNMARGGSPAVNFYRLSGKQPGDVASFQISGFPQQEIDFTWVVLAVVFLVVIVVAVRRMKPKKN